MRWYKFWYALGLVFMSLFFLSSLNIMNPLYIVLSGVCFIECARTYDEK
jgi:hypothetical protein